MTTIPLDERQTLIVAILVLFLGKFLIAKVAMLREFNIPQPVVGGVLVSVMFSIVYFGLDIELTFDLRLRDVLLVSFFTTIGLSSRVSTLIAGGKPLLTLLVIAVVYLVLQNLTGIAVAAAAGLPLSIGLIGGSVSLSGGHGTTIAWAPTFINDHGVQNALEIGVACATFGLVLGGIVGGPVAKFLTARDKLQCTSDEMLAVGLRYEQSGVQIDVESVLNTILVVAVAIGLGLALNEGLAYLGLKLPEFVTCLFAGIILTNTVPLLARGIRWPTGTPTLALVSDLCLGLFLSMSLMSLQLWSLVDLAGPIILLLVAQLVMICLFVVFVVYRLMGRNYDAAVISAGYAGLALGATPTAIANMEAVTQKYGPSPLAFIVVPLVGAFFIDIANAFIIRYLLDHVT